MDVLGFDVLVGIFCGISDKSWTNTKMNRVLQKLENSQQSIAMSMRNIIIPSIELLEFHDLTGRSLSVTDGHS